jgi:hypothetical protein
MDMKGNFAPYMDVEAEYPELREFFEKAKASVSQTNGVATNGTHDSGEAILKIEKNGILTVQNEFVEHVPVTV